MYFSDVLAVPSTCDARNSGAGAKPNGDGPFGPHVGCTAIGFPMSGSNTGAFNPGPYLTSIISIVGDPITVFLYAAAESLPLMPSYSSYSF